MLKLVKNELNLIGFEPTDWTQPTRWEVFKKFKWFDYIHDNKLILVQFKKQFKIKQSKNLTRWDILFMLVDKIRDFELDTQWIIDWLTFNQKYNDDTQMFDIYAKWINEETIKNYKEILDFYWITYEKTQKWIKLMWEKTRWLNQIYDELMSSEDLNYILSFIYWLSLFYWRVQIKEIEKNKFIFLWFQVNFNFKDLWVDIDSLVDKLKDLFKKENLIINISLNNTNLTFSSNDYEFDKFIWKLYLWGFSEIEYWREKHAIENKEKLLNYIENWIEWLDNKNDAIQLIKNNYIKLIW